MHQRNWIAFIWIKKTNLAKQIQDTRLTTVNVDRHTIGRYMNKQMFNGFQIYV